MTLSSQFEKKKQNICDRATVQFREKIIFVLNVLNEYRITRLTCNSYIFTLDVKKYVQPSGKHFREFEGTASRSRFDENIEFVPTFTDASTRNLTLN